MLREENIKDFYGVYYNILTISQKLVVDLYSLTYSLNILLYIIFITFLNI